ncbi:NfeD family protein [Nitratireductor sp. L1-7-SE]|uniref:NfeD family protein n=1 Tax=Nitratireductor rhodophyticola TaxID=2854036 RepID=A0ABS7RAU4_9HYPH|nr:NfeD family protein [Nitratireductor rhodophyticola]MBY8917724.1 NfeD family protein [Nitratireductor rhodophyticola]MBY8922435.1 NfeD family protein [Nitratireductor rhodophyticola]
MIEHVIAELGPWNWMLLGFVLLAAEILAPGVFLLWIGIAAILTGALSLQLWDLPAWSWQVQVLVFLALSLISAYAGKRLMDSRRNEETDQPLLNRRREQLVGRTATLEEAIENGFGRIRLDDTLWRVTGPELPAGTRVRVASVDAGTLRVEAV